VHRIGNSVKQQYRFFISGL